MQVLTSGPCRCISIISKQTRPTFSLNLNISPTISKMSVPEKNKPRTSSDSQISRHQTGDVGILHRVAYKLYPPPRPNYGPNSLSRNSGRPTRIEKVLHTLFPPDITTDVPWYLPSLLRRLESAGSEFYRSHMGLEGADLASHVHDIRDRAWAIEGAQYPCIGRGWFLLPGLAGTESWQDVIVRAAKDGESILDMGCGLGQDVRRLRSETGLKTKLYAVDVEKEMWELGSALFGDGDPKIPVAEFLCADAQQYAPGFGSFGKGGSLEKLRGSIDVVLMSKFLDLFEWNASLSVLKTVVELSHIGTRVVCCCIGTQRGKACHHASEGGPAMYPMVHDDRSIHSLFMDLNVSTHGGTTWNVESELVDLKRWGFDEDDVACISHVEPMGLQFVATRLT